MKTSRMTKKDCATFENTKFDVWWSYLNEELHRRGLPEVGFTHAHNAYEVGQSPWTEANEIEAQQ